MMMMSNTRMITVGALSVAAAIAAPAAAGSATLTVATVGGQPGQTVPVKVYLSTDDLVGAFAFQVDASGLVVAGVDYNGPLFANGWNGWDTTPAVGASVNAACIFPQDQITGSNLPLLDLLIEIPADAPPSSEIAVGLTAAQVSDYSFIPYDVTVIAGSIVTTSTTCAEDIDANGVVGFSDVLAIIAQWGACSGACAADVNADGSVSMADLLMVIGQWGACR